MLRALRLVAVLTLALWAVLVSLREDLLGDIAGVFNSIVSIPCDVLRAIWHAITGVVNFFGRLADILGGAWDFMVNGFEWLGDRASWLAGATFQSLGWVIGHWAPGLASWALGKAVGWAQGAVHTVERWVSALVSDALRWARGAINTVEGWARDTFRAVWGEIKKAADWIAQAGGYVFGILAHPTRLVQWILADLVAPLLDYLIQAGAPVFAWILRGFRTVLPELAHTLEDVLAKVL